MSIITTVVRYALRFLRSRNRCLASALCSTAVLIAACADQGRETPSAPSTPIPVALKFAQDPARTLYGRPFNPVVQVYAVDATGQVVPTDNVVVTLRLHSAGTTPVTLTGPTTQTTVAGKATFTNVAPTAAGDSMTLVANASGIPETRSQWFKIDALPIGVDSTVLHLTSDSAALMSGRYCFQALRGGSPTIDSGKVLAGSQRGGFLRRVVRVDQNGPELCAQTVPAGLDEVLQYDSLGLHLTLAGSASSQRAEGVARIRRQAYFEPASSAIVGSGMQFSIKNLQLLADVAAYKGVTLVEARLRLDPTLDLDVAWAGLLRPASARAALGGVAIFDATFDVGLSKAVERSGSILLGTAYYPFEVPVPTGLFAVPIPAEFSVPITLEWAINGSGKVALTFGFVNTSNMSVGVDWSAANGWTFINAATNTFVPEWTTLQINASLSTRFALLAKPRLVIARAAGGDLWAEPYAEGTVTADVVQNRWATACRSGVAVGVDLDLRFFGYTIGVFNRSKTLLDTAWPVCARSGALGYLINVTATPLNGGTVSGGGTYASGSTVALRATAADRYDFLGWKEGATQVSSNPTYSFPATANRTLTAVFVAQPVSYVIATSASPPNGGTVTGGGTFEAGTPVTVVALPYGGNKADGWWEGSTQVSSSDRYSFTVTSNRTLTARFSAVATAATFTISTVAEPTTRGSTTGGGTFEAGTPVTVVALPYSGSKADGWWEGPTQVSSSDRYSFTVAGNRTVTARFSAISSGGPETLATGLNRPWSIATDGSRIFWIEDDATAGALRSVGVAGGGVTTHAQGLKEPRAIALDGDQVYILERNGGASGSLKRISISSGAVATVASGLRNVQNHMSIDGTHVYLGEEGAVGRGTIRRVNKNSGQVETLVSDNQYLTAAVTTDGSYVYYGDGYGNIRRVPKSGGTATVLGPGTATAIILVGENLFWTEGSGAVKRMPSRGGAVTTVASGPDNASNLTSDGSNIFWVLHQSGGGVYKVSVNGGAVTTIGTEANSIGIALSGSHVYWAVLDPVGKIMRALK